MFNIDLTKESEQRHQPVCLDEGRRDAGRASEEEAEGQHWLATDPVNDLRQEEDS